LDKKSARPNGRKIAVEMADMLPVSTPAETRSFSGKKSGFFRRMVEWPFSPEFFQLELLVGTAVSLPVINVLTVACELRTQIIAATRLNRVAENDNAALENAHRGHLLASEDAHGKNASRLRLRKGSEEHPRCSLAT
jgi:hypothetical protein